MAVQRIIEGIIDTRVFSFFLLSNQEATHATVLANMSAYRVSRGHIILMNDCHYCAMKSQS